eukprot:1431654-Lingulodinium_polyedra.AAC.1
MDAARRLQRFSLRVIRCRRAPARGRRSSARAAGPPCAALWPRVRAALRRRRGAPAFPAAG